MFYVCNIELLWYISLVLFITGCVCLLHDCLLKFCSVCPPDIGSELDEKVLQLFEERYSEKLAELNLEAG